MILLNVIKDSPAYQDVLRAVRQSKNLPGLGLPRSARLPFLATIYSDLNKPILLVADRGDHALSIMQELAFWLPESPCYLFAEPTPLFYEDASWGSVIKLQRLQVISTLSEYHLPPFNKPEKPPIIITTPRALMTKTISRREYLRAIRRISKGDLYHPDSISRELLEMGYESVDTVLEPGQYCKRGGITDLWTPGSKFPWRVEFFGNEIDTLRCFKPETQRTIETIEKITISPAREFISPINVVPSDDIKKFTEFQIPILHPNSSSLLDYLPQKSLIVFEDISLVETEISQFEDQAIKLRNELENDNLLDPAFPLPYFSWGELFEVRDAQYWIELGYSTAINEMHEEVDSNRLSSQFSSIEHFGGRLKQVMEFLEESHRERKSICVISRQASRLKELWEEKETLNKPPEVLFIEASLIGGWGFEKWLLISDAEIFGWERPQPRSIPRVQVENPELVFGDIAPGAWIVHVDYGIGHFIGLVRRLLDGQEREFLCVEFQNKDQVFVPIHQADRLTKYIGPGGAPPSPGHIGTQAWPETKKKVKQAVEEVALDLLDLYAKRKVTTGYAFKQDTAWQGELESSFPYIETPDQIKALVEIKNDMETSRPMDRLLCGDVGYGKTEVALRAAFKAVMDGKQAAVLVPTTVLAQQHYETFQQRLAAFPVVVEMLSRFRSEHEQNQIIGALQQGRVDIIIGTHRLISKDVKFKDLGLVIIDEEQRFGVTHKERLKHLREEVDVLTLTATPIPRTLYMALTGVRDISNLFTPPEERLPIVTHIGPYSPKLVHQAILREVERGGQVFFVHNRVHTIHGMKMHLEKLVPEARIAIAHGQMNEQELASVMHRFTNGEIDILLSTSIIESGLDIPNANTLIVDRGDAFGLAQLYQLRGRVGRGAVRAYAYFFRHKKLSPTPEGQERLETIAENSNLGSGYSIAMRDLEMRGAGDLLGTRQSGHIAAVGFYMYTRLLSVAVRHLQKKESAKTTIPGFTLNEFDNQINVDLPQEVSIPENYVPDNQVRLRLYRRMANLPDEPALDALAEEFVDRFGPLPEPVSNLIFQIRVKIRALRANLASVGMEAGQIVLRFPATNTGKREPRLPDLGAGVRGGKNAYWCSFANESDWKQRLLSVLDRLTQNKTDITLKSLA